MKTPRMLRTEPLTAEAFAPFGQVLEAREAKGASSNQGTALRLDRVAALHSSRPGCAPNLAMVRSAPQALPMPLRLLERHPCSSQAFIPLACSRYLVVVAPTASGGEPEWSQMRAFIASSGQGINYAMGTWHHPFIALDTPAELALLVWEDGTARDCEERELPEPTTVFGVPPT